MVVNGVFGYLSASSEVSLQKEITSSLDVSLAKGKDSLNEEVMWEHMPDRSPGDEAGLYTSFKGISELEKDTYRETYKGDRIPEEKGKQKEEGERVEDPTGLSEEEREEVERLRKRDREVRAHENAHRAAAGRYAGPIRYEYVRGPDGKMYAVGGSTQIDTSIPEDPEEAYQKAKILQAAATAPGTNLSESDRRLAAAARKMAQQAARRMAEERRAEISIESDDTQAQEIDQEKDHEKIEIKVEGLGRLPTELTEEEKELLEKLKKRDQEVRRHEQAHAAAAGPYKVSGPHYVYQRGPDGRMYAIGGSVVLDTSPVEGDPEATLRKAQVIRRAALAPLNPSSQDRRVAAEASQMAIEARRELLEEKIDGGDEEKEGSPFKIEDLVQEKMVSPEIAREIIKKKQENPDISPREIKEWLKRTKGEEVSEEEIRRILRNMNHINIYNNQNNTLGEILDAVA